MDNEAFQPNQHLSNKGIKYTINSLGLALFGYLGIQYSTERSDVASTKKGLTLPTGLVNLPFLQTGIVTLFRKKKQ